MKSGVYFVHYDDIDAFLEAAKKAGRTPFSKGTRDKVKNEAFKNLYRVFSLDNDSFGDSKRIGYWDACELDAMKTWKDWSFTDKYIEHWQPNKKKVIL